MENLVNNDELGSFFAAKGITEESPGTEENGGGATETPEQIQAKQDELDYPGKTPEEIILLKAEKAAGTKTAEEQQAAEDALKYPGKSPEEIVKLKEDELAKAAEDQKEADIERRLMEKLGIKSVDEIQKLRDQVNKTPLTPEQEAENLKKYNTDMTAYAIGNNLITTQELADIEQLKGMSDRDIVFRDFAAEYREQFKERTKEDGSPEPVTDEEISTAFDTLYNLDSDNPVLKQKGEQMMKDRADSVKKLSGDKLAGAKEEFDRELHKKSNVPVFKTFMQDAIKSALPESITLMGEGDGAINFKLVDESGKPIYDLKEIEKLFVNDVFYDTYLNSKDLPKLKAYVGEKIMDHIESTHKLKIRAAIYDSGKAAGLKEGSNTGATQPFGSRQKEGVVTSDKEFSQEDLNNLKSQFGNN